MSNLLKAGIRRYVSSILFWLALAVTLGNAVYMGLWAKSWYLEDFGIFIQLMVFAVLMSLQVGREYEEGAFRNKIIRGHSKGIVYLSELVLGLGVCSVLFLLMSIIFGALNGYTFFVIPVSILLRLFFGFWLANMILVGIIITISCLVSRRAIAGIVGILFVLGMYYFAYNVDNVLDQEEFWYEYDTYTEEYTDENGITYQEEIMVEGSEKPIKNPHYVEGPLRIVYMAAYELNPYGYILEYMDSLYWFFGYNFHDFYPAYEGGDWDFDQEERKNININLLESLLAMGVVLVVGYASFSKKDMK